MFLRTKRFATQSKSSSQTAQSEPYNLKASSAQKSQMKGACMTTEKRAGFAGAVIFSTKNVLNNVNSWHIFHIFHPASQIAAHQTPAKNRMGVLPV